MTHEIDVRRCQEALLELSEIVSQIAERKQAAAEITRGLRGENAKIKALQELLETARARFGIEEELEMRKAERQELEGWAHQLTLRLADEIDSLEGRRPALFAVLPMEVLACHAALVGAGRLPTLASADGDVCGECRHPLEPETRQRLDSHFEFCPGCGRFLYLASGFSGMRRAH